MATLARLPLSRREFRRQVPFDRFVVDFYCHAAKLVVELDGKQHEWFSDYDAGRTEVLERLGVRVIPFTNAEVCDDLDSVLEQIAFGSNRDRHCERSEAIQVSSGALRPWIAASLRSSR